MRSCAPSPARSASGDSRGCRRSAFSTALRGVTDPEEKRKIIGRLFIEVFEEQARRLSDIALSGAGHDLSGRDRVGRRSDRQGAGDQVPSQRRRACRRTCSFQLVEPLRELFKDEVRRIGIELGLPHELVYRHPFPGPGLGVRILGEVRREYADLLRRADHIFIEELRRTGSTSAPARRSRCSCRCARSASWATGAAMST